MGKARKSRARAAEPESKGDTVEAERRDKQPGFQDRIIELRTVQAKELLENPKNWRTHDDEQKAALQGVMEAIGFADALIAYESGGNLILINGHLRKQSVDPEQELSVLVTDLTEVEAGVALASFDKVGDMAATDKSLLKELAERVEENFDLDLDLFHDGLIGSLRDAAVIAGEGDKTPAGAPRLIRMGKWKVPLTEDGANRFADIIRAYIEKEGTVIGMDLEILEALPTFGED